MAISFNKKVKVNGKIFTFANLFADQSIYIPIIREFFRESTLVKKDGETEYSYCERIFRSLYYNKGFGIKIENKRKAINDACSSILNTLGIDIIKRCGKSSKVLFKNSGALYRMRNDDIDALEKGIKNKVSYKRNNVSIKFGVEIEFIGNRQLNKLFNNEMVKVVGVSRYEDKGQYNKNDGKKWILGTDGSVGRRLCSPMKGYELTSPILDINSEKDISELKKVCSLIKNKFMGYTDNSCGCYIHMSFDGRPTDALLNYLSNTYGDNELTLFDKVVPPRRRESKSQWCRSNKHLPMCDYSRYQKLNFANVKKC